MTKFFKKLNLAGVVLVVALLAPATATAFHVFDDVADNRFYAEPVEWAFNNGITTGRSPTIFDPDAGVTRGESVTFLRRYDVNIVQPKFTAIDTAIANTYTKAQVDANTYTRGQVDALLPDLRWAKVDADVGGATLIRHSGATGVSRIGVGIFKVDFAAPINGCGWVGTLNDNAAGGSLPGEISIEQASGLDTDSLWVRTYDSTGAAADPDASDGFTVQLFC